jgi:hypothetical protein
MLDRLTLVVLIEDETAKLSHEGREKWQDYNTAVYLSDDDERIPSPEQQLLYARMGQLPQSDKDVVERLKTLWAGLYQSDFDENRGKSGVKEREAAVIHAARLKDRAEGRERAPNRSLDDALDRLGED